MSLSTKLNAFKEMMRMDNGVQLVLSRIFTPGETLQVCRFRGLEFVTDLSAGDANGARQVLATDEYRRFFPRMDLRGHMNVLDLGANNGGFPLLIVSEGVELNNLLCVEMNPNTCSRLKSNLERNFGDRFVPLNAAVTGKSGDITVRDSTGGTGDSIYAGPDQGSNVRTVRGMTFDEVAEQGFAGETIDICKIDVEGAEFEILAGEGCKRLADCRYLLMEIHHSPERQRDIVISGLENYGLEEVIDEVINDDFHHVHLFRNRRFNTASGKEEQPSG